MELYSMAKLFPQVVSSIKLPVAALLAIVLSQGLALRSWSDDASPQLKPYTAKYVTKAKGLSLTLDRKLSRKANGGYKLTNGGSKLVAGFQEESHFQVENSRVVPQSYVYQGTGLMNRRREVHFIPGADTLRSFYKDEWYELPYTKDTFDRMSQQEQIRLQLMMDDTPQQVEPLTVADGKRVKSYQLLFVAEEILDTPMGKIKTLHFNRHHEDPERSSDLWLAPDWDFLMVKTLHVDEGSPVEVKLTAAVIDGVAL
jgi:Protein of unknown function (DUF3108)